ncbi:MAG: ParB/RepB/Spo0J family partition protein [Oscillospiraceae bacterium]|nr:ParB/RepB/Spo0J family partition protein [Oscillospiraceae bacterium]
MTGLFGKKEKVAAQVVMLEVGELVPNKSQPRRQFSEEQLLSLSQSIKENGIIQPICVRKKGAVYEIISGERRTRAAKLAGLNEVPCIVMEADDEQSAVLALIENIQRKDLSYFEEALAIEKLISFYGLTQEVAAARLGKAQSTIANKLRLLRFTDTERRMLIMGNLNERQARALVRIDNVELRLNAIEKTVTKNLNLSETEELVNQVLNGAPKRERKQRKKPPVTAPPRLYMNSLNALLKRIREDKIPCELSTEKSEEFYEYTIRFPISACN